MWLYNKKYQWMMFAAGLVVSQNIFADSPEKDSLLVKTESTEVDSSARIGVVNINLDPIFDESNEDEDNFLFRLANKLKIRTDPDVLRKDLLFNQGERFDEEKVKESARILRTRRYLNKVNITTEPQDNGMVDVNVNAREVWTLFATAGFSRSGGNNESVFGIKDTDIFGTGKTVLYSYRSSDERDSHNFEYQDPNTGWYNSSLSMVYSDNSDGYRHFLELKRPFFSLYSPNTGGFFFEGYESEQKLYNEGDDVDAYAQKVETFGLLYGHRLPLDRKNRVHRLIGGYEHTEKDFYRIDDEDNNFDLPENREFDFTWLEYRSIPDRFIEAYNLRQINRIEDINQGIDARFRVSYVLSPNDLFDETFHLDSSIKSVHLQNQRNMLVSSINASGFYTDEGVQNGLATVNINYHWRNMDRGQLYINLHRAHGQRLFADQQLELGGDNGLRGYPEFYTFGSDRYLLNIEQRFYGTKEWFSLFHLAGVIFYDQGRAWGESVIEQEYQGHLRDWGVGVRISGTRSGGRDSGANSVIHLDLAQPLDGGDDLDSWQWSATVKTSF